MINSQFFKSEIIEKKKSAYIAFIASWCTPSMMEKQIFEAIAKEYENKDLIIDVIDVDQEPELAMEYKAHTLPTIATFDNGEHIDNFYVYVNNEDLKDSIDSYLKDKAKMEAEAASNETKINKKTIILITIVILILITLIIINYQRF